MDTSTPLQRDYAAARSLVPAGTAITVLHLGEASTELAVGQGAEPSARLSLHMGSHSTASAYFRHTPPTPGEIENAIMVVEDEVTRARSLVAGHGVLFCFHPSLQTMAGLAHATDRSMAVEAVEGLFDLLAALSQGRPASSAGIPNTPDFAATLLVLREFMHHLGFAEVRW